MRRRIELIDNPSVELRPGLSRSAKGAESFLSGAHQARLRLESMLRDGAGAARRAHLSTLTL